MRELATDAAPAKSIANTQEENDLDLEILGKIESGLEPFEKLTLLFLILDNYRCYDEVYRAFSLLNAENVLCKFVETIGNWQEKVYEALCITKAKGVIRLLGKSYDELCTIYVPRVNLPNSKVHWGAKMLFEIFDNFIDERKNQLLQSIYGQMKRPEELRNEDPLELHALYWLQQEYISLTPDGYGDLTRIQTELKILGLSKDPIFLDIQKFCDRSKQKFPCSADVQPRLNNSLALNGNMCQKKGVTSSTECAKSIIETAYVLVINEVNFWNAQDGEELEKRESSRLDVEEIRKTFGGFDKYKITVYNDVTADQIREIFFGLKDIFATEKYDGLFVWILSHGIKGHFVSSDGRDIPFSFIEDSVCIRELRDRPKVAVVQACQGKKLGVPGDHDLTYDGPGDYSQYVNTADRREFFIFSATMSNCKAIRSKTKGTWFIKACCDVICKAKDEGHQLSLHAWTKKVKHNVAQCKGELKPGIIASQLPEVCNDRSICDFYFPLHSRKKMEDEKIRWRL